MDTKQRYEAISIIMNGVRVLTGTDVAVFHVPEVDDDTWSVRLLFNSGALGENYLEVARDPKTMILTDIDQYVDRFQELDEPDKFRFMVSAIAGYAGGGMFTAVDTIADVGEIELSHYGVICYMNELVWGKITVDDDEALGNTVIEYEKTTD